MLITLRAYRVKKSQSLKPRVEHTYLKFTGVPFQGSDHVIFMPTFNFSYKLISSCNFQNDNRIRKALNTTFTHQVSHLCVSSFCLQSDDLLFKVLFIIHALIKSHSCVDKFMSSTV